MDADTTALTCVALASAVIIAVTVGAYVYRSTGVKSTKNESTAVKLKQAEESVDDPTKPRVRLLYGTQTGTAERFTKQLASELRKKYGGSTLIDVVDLENYKPQSQLPSEKLVVLCVATYGDGEPTDNAAAFFTWLGKEVDAVECGEKSPPLEGLAYAVFGLGNKQYEHFNAMGKKAYKALGVLGARPVVRRGDGDDDVCIDDDFDKWTAEFMQALESRSDLVGAEQAVNGTALQADESVAYDVEVLTGGKEDPVFPEGGSGKDHHSIFWATVTAARELHTPTSGRSCVHVELDISGCAATYETGDHVGIHAANSDAVVDEVAKLLGLDLDALVRLRLPKEKKGSGLMSPPDGALSVRSLLTWHSDLLSSPHKDALAALSRCATNPAHAARFALLASHDGKQEYADWVARPHRSLLEVLREMPTARPTLGVLFASILPRLQPRYYSISSSARMHPRHVHITCAVVRDLTETGRVHEGVASSFLQRQLVAAHIGSKVPMFIRTSHFKLPADACRPIVMVGPGTGLAPFRGFLQERRILRDPQALSGLGNGWLVNGNGNGNHHDADKPLVGPAVLFFGCRKREGDFIYEEELRDFVKTGDLSALHVAFSRDGPTKDYVQHHMEREAQTLWRLLDSEAGYLYICGDAKNMAKDVHRTLVALVAQAKGCSDTQAEAWVKHLQDSGRYQRDVW